jgi:sulfate permease, SulP family
MKTISSSEAQKSVPGALRVIETVIPGVRVIRTYHRRWLHADVVAGVTIFAMLMQQGMAYGGLAGSRFSRWPACSDWYSGRQCVFGSSRRATIGTETSFAIRVAITLLLIAERCE